MRQVLWPLGVVATLFVWGCNPPPSAFTEPRPENASCVAPPRPSRIVELERAYEHLVFDEPVQMTLSPDGGHWYLAEKAGLVWRFAAADPSRRELVLDFSSRVKSERALGLLGLALHPSFADNGEMFLSYTGPGGSFARAVLSSVQSEDGGASFDIASEQIVLAYDLSTHLHTNNEVRFGPDGTLFWSTGDGGPHGDPDGHAQSKNSLRGKVLRIDVDGGEPYAIPADNPFASGGGAPEVWAYGLRNPWRFTFDRTTGDMWLGDVGWRNWEEVDRVTPGGNYGWPLAEGSTCMPEADCASVPIIPPVVEHSHDEARSVTMGYVYRGERIPALAGQVVYADFVGGYIWAIDPEPKDAGPTPRVINGDGHNIVSFAEDGAGELLIIDFVQGSIWRLVPGGSAQGGVEQDVAGTLGETGCFTSDGEALPGLIPYQLNVPFWSDGADKRRWFALPNDTTIELDADEDFVFPIGSVLAKEFQRDGLRLETRLLVRHSDGEWAGYTYRWNQAQTVADLVPQMAGSTVSMWGDRRWYHPRRNECFFCHTAAGGRTLGPQAAQLGRSVILSDGRVVDQLDHFTELGLFAEPAPSFKSPPLVEPFGEAPLSDRARAWLDVNCSMCHRPGGGGQGEIDLRITTSLAETVLCNVAPEFGDLSIENALRLAPGEPERSVLLARVRATNGTRMPPTTSFVADEDGAFLLEAWIASLDGCED